VRTPGVIETQPMNAASIDTRRGRSLFWVALAILNSRALDGEECPFHGGLVISRLCA